MTTSLLSIGGVYSLLSSLEQAAMKSTDARVQAFGASMSNSLSAFKDAVPGLAAALVNAGIDAMATSEPIFKILIPAEAVIDPAVSGLASVLEGMLLPSSASTPATVTTTGTGGATVPQQSAE